MSRSLSTIQICCGAVALALASVMVCSAQTAGRQRSRPIEFSEPRSDEVTTNLHQLTSKKDGLKQLEEDLYAPLQSFAPRSSLEGVTAPPPRAPAPSAIQSKRIKELLERRKNWVFMTPEDLLSAPTVEQILKAPEYGADGQEKKDVRPINGYYDRLSPRRPGKQKASPTAEEDLFSVARKRPSPDVAPGREESDLPSGVKESALALKSFFEMDESGSRSEAAKAGSLSDPFGLGGKPPSQEQVLEHKKLMDRYHVLVDPSWHPPAAPRAGTLLPAFGEGSQPATKAATDPFGVARETAHKGLDAQLDVINPLLGPPGLPDVNAKALGQSRPALPKVDARRVIPTVPDFAAPKRAF